jgi:hypothetical protein
MSLRPALHTIAKAALQRRVLLRMAVLVRSMQLKASDGDRVQVNINQARGCRSQVKCDEQNRMSLRIFAAA